MYYKSTVKTGSVKTGNVKTVKWLDLKAEHLNQLTVMLHVVTSKYSGGFMSTAHAMDIAAAAGHLNVVKWRHLNRSEGCSNQALTHAIISGHLDVVLFLYLHCEKEIVLNDYKRQFCPELQQWLLTPKLHRPSQQLAFPRNRLNMDTLHLISHHNCEQGVTRDARSSQKRWLLNRTAELAASRGDLPTLQ
ncbi:hypothetical protein PHMEG_00019005 [Phytophthora megakarya]|uniref:Uncharacterized protein n=1 Tax=Phytophthora megakarya TaxID=4795 RepID=A0A225VSD1_9STRA|nr:hypothetical protein PHMEG_00019005 [Phytophthora megakarya]